MAQEIISSEKYRPVEIIRRDLRGWMQFDPVGDSTESGASNKPAGRQGNAPTAQVTINN